MNKTKLIIRRVVISSNRKSVYDEDFHVGLNIIRGYNGTGKSTIMELISYGLGGDIKKNCWKREALQCNEIIIDLYINGKEYVFKRDIENESSKPQIKIYDGSYEESLTDPSKWTVYKNKKSETRKSYSMQIFELLGLEQHNTADSESLTMHQLLRVLYVDQDTPSSKIFRTEPFIYDKESMRKAIGEYSFGFDNLRAHALRQKLYIANKKFDKLHDELNTIYKVLGETNIKATTIEIDGDIMSLKNDLIEINNKRLLARKNNISSVTTDLSNKSKGIQAEIENKSNMVSRLEEEFVSVSYEIIDSREFIITLENRKIALKKAKLTYNEISQISFMYCPSCMAAITNEHEEGHCALCKSPTDIENTNMSYVLALNELDFQLSETRQMLDLKNSEHARLKATLKIHKERLDSLRSDFNEINTFTNDYEVAITTLASEKGFIEAQIEDLNDKLKLATKLDQKREEKSLLQKNITELSDKLDALEASNIKRVKKVKYTISEKVIEILKEDGGIEPAFDDAEKFEFDFSTDSMRLDDRANFSASSNVILKNSFHLATLLTALEDDGFRIPCFSMFDNVEDKGMIEERSQKFQKTIANLCSDIHHDFQIIMTTSMVDPSLNNDKYGVGPYYTKGKHTLNM